MNYIAVDWGTSNFRAMRVGDGHIQATVQSDKGIGRCQRQQLPAILQQEIHRLGEHYDSTLPVILCGMVGSNIGIIDAGYQPLPLACAHLSLPCATLEAEAALIAGLNKVFADV